MKSISSSINFCSEPRLFMMFMAFWAMLSMSFTAMRYRRNSLGVLKPSSRYRLRSIPYFSWRTIYSPKPVYVIVSADYTVK